MMIAIIAMLNIYVERGGLGINSRGEHSEVAEIAQVEMVSVLFENFEIPPFIMRQYAVKIASAVSKLLTLCHAEKSEEVLLQILEKILKRAQKIGDEEMVQFLFNVVRSAREGIEK